MTSRLLDTVVLLVLAFVVVALLVDESSAKVSSSPRNPHDRLHPNVRSLVQKRRQSMGLSSSTTTNNKRQSNNNDCHLRKCLPLGSNCTYSYEECAWGLYCDLTSFTCLQQQANGGACDYSNSFDSNPLCWSTVDFYAIQCLTTNVCGYGEDSLYPNDFCNNDLECSFSSVCSNGRCTGIALNGVCTYSEECAYGLYCANKTCVARIPLGESCHAAISASSGETDVCDGFSSRYCSADPQNLCVAPLSLPAGSLCTWVDQCEKDTYCAFQDDEQRGMCVAVPTGPVPCTTVGSNECGEATGYGFEQTCDCDATGTGGPTCHGIAPLITSPCTDSDYLNLQQCLRENQCSSMELDNLYMGASLACASKFCAPQISCMNYCATLTEVDGIAKGCTYVSKTWTCPVSAGVSVETSSAMMMSLLLAIAIAFVN